MSAEAEIQRSFAGFLRRRKDLTKDEEARRFADEHIAGNDRLSPVEQLEIYREQFWLRHTASLVEDFPGVGGLLGQARWERLVVGYLEQRASFGYSLRDLGVHLAEYSETEDWLQSAGDDPVTELAASERALVADMARYEWARIEVFDADDRPRLDPERLRGVPEAAWEGAKLVLDPALRLVETRYPVGDLYRQLVQARTERAELATPERPPPAATYLAVHRRDRIIRSEPLAAGSFFLLRALGNGVPLGKACETAAPSSGTDVEELGQNLERWFADWASRGYFIDVLVDPSFGR